jgi:myb proto-oncogene protein
MRTAHRPTKPKLCRRKGWTAAEDSAIVNLVIELGTKHWSVIADKLRKAFRIKGRTGKQCRERWHNHLNPCIEKGAWTMEEERTLFLAHGSLGNKWAEISKLLTGRTDNSIKNHYYSSARKEFRRLKGVEPSRSQLKDFGEHLTCSIMKRLNHRHKADEGLLNTPIENPDLESALAVSAPAYSYKQAEGDEYFSEELLEDMVIELDGLDKSFEFLDSSSAYTECATDLLWTSSEEDWEECLWIN